MSNLNTDTGFSAKKTKQFFVLVIIVLTGVLLFNQLLFIISAFFGAVTLYILLRRPHKRLVSRYRWKKIPATLFLITCSIILFLVPFYFIIRFVLARISPFLTSPEPLINTVNTINTYINSRFDFTLLSAENLTRIKELATHILPQIIGSGLLNLTELVMLYFLLWFMLNSSFKMERWLKANSPFKRIHTLLIFNEIKKSVTNNAVGIVILGMVQGIAAIIGYYLFGVDEPILWGLITGAASVIPFAGTMAVWVPMVILLFARGDTMQGTGLIFWGLFLIGGIDNVLRFMVQKRIAQTHPLITVLGVIVGLKVFGFWGLIYGPLMFSIFTLLCRIYKNEFILDGRNKPDKKMPATG